MIETKYENIPNELFSNYLKFLINRVYKILPLQEMGDPNLNIYIFSLQRELIGNLELIKAMRYDGEFLCLLNKIQYIIFDNNDHGLLRKDVLDCISIIQKLQKRYGFE